MEGVISAPFLLHNGSGGFGSGGFLCTPGCCFLHISGAIYRGGWM
ncbi:MAG: hypothetical protein ACOWWR_01790 [Eubacteriales bacterium]